MRHNSNNITPQLVRNHNSLRSRYIFKEFPRISGEIRRETLSESTQYNAHNSSSQQIPTYNSDDSIECVKIKLVSKYLGLVGRQTRQNSASRRCSVQRFHEPSSRRVEIKHSNWNNIHNKDRRHTDRAGLRRCSCAVAHASPRYCAAHEVTIKRTVSTEPWT